MSLVEEDLRLERQLGVVFLLVLTAAIAVVFILPGHSLRRYITFQVEFSTPGTLRPHAPIRVAGRDVGEVQRLRYEHKADGQPRVIADCALVASWARRLPRNSQFFVATPSIIGESFLELGPPRPGAPLAPSISAGDVVRGVDPADLSSLAGYIQKEIRSISGQLREHKAEFDELRAASNALASTYKEVLSNEDQLKRIRDQAAHAQSELRAIKATLDVQRTAGELSTIWHELSATFDEVTPDAQALGEDFTRVKAEVDGLQSMWKSEKRRTIRGLRMIGRGINKILAAGTQIEQLVDEVRRGGGTIGGLLTDRALREESRELRQIVKKRPWKVLFKGKEKREP